MKSNLKVRRGLKGGRIAFNHNISGLAVRSGIKDGRIALNHNISGLAVIKKMTLVLAM